MQSRPLFEHGPLVSRLGLGLWPLTGAMGKVSREQALATIAAAADHGITFFDASRNAPETEVLVAEALRGRSDCLVATKVFPGSSRSQLESAVDDSLRALGTDCLGLLQLQGWYPGSPIDQVVADAHDLVKAGKVRAVGVCNFDGSTLEVAVKGGPIVSNQLEFSLLRREAEGEDFEACARAQTAVIAHSALAKGLLSGRYRKGHRFDQEDERSSFADIRRRLESGVLDELHQLAEGAGRSLRELALAWMASRDHITTLVGAKSPEQVVENVAAVENPLDEALLAAVDEATASSQDD